MINNTKTFTAELTKISRATSPKRQKTIEFKTLLKASEFSDNDLIKEFVQYGLFMLENGTRKKRNPAISTVVGYLSAAPLIEKLLEGKSLKSLSSLELTILFEEFEEVKGQKSQTHASLLNLFTYLNTTYKLKLDEIDLTISSESGTDANVFWSHEFKALIDSSIFTQEEELFITTLYETKARISEIYQLTTNDISLISRALFIRINTLGGLKNSQSARTIFFDSLPHGIVVTLTQLKTETKRNQPIFDVDKNTNTQKDFEKYKKIINRKIRAVLNRQVSLKHFRHSSLIEEPSKPNTETSLQASFECCALRGHATPATTDKHYIHSCPMGNKVMGLTTKQIKELTGSSEETVKKQRQRLPNRLGNVHDDNGQVLLKKISNELKNRKKK